MGRVLLFLVPLIIALIALIDCLSSESDEVRGLPKVVWVFVILLFPLLGSLAWFFAGRPHTAARRPGTWAPGGGFPESSRPRPVAPDDDPEFLRGLSKSPKEDEELLRKWEEDLRKREDELRKRDDETK